MFLAITGLVLGAQISWLFAIVGAVSGWSITAIGGEIMSLISDENTSSNIESSLEGSPSIIMDDFDEDVPLLSDSEEAINPATGLTMIGGVDAGGNVYGGIEDSFGYDDFNGDTFDGCGMDSGLI